MHRTGLLCVHAPWVEAHEIEALAQGLRELGAAVLDHFDARNRPAHPG